MVHIPIIPVFKMLRQEDQKLEASLGYIVKSCLECVCVCVNLFMCKSGTGAGDMAHWVETLTSKPDNLPLTPRNHRTDAHKLSPGSHVLSVAPRHSHTLTRAHTQSVNIGQCKILRCL